MTQQSEPLRLADTPARDVPIKTPPLTDFAGQRIYIRDVEWRIGIDGKPLAILDIGRRDAEGRPINGDAQTSSRTVVRQLKAAEQRVGGCWKSQGGPGMAIYVCQKAPARPGNKPGLYLSDEPPSELGQAFDKRGK